MKKCSVIIILGIMFITCIILFSRNDFTTVYCTKCKEAWTVCNITDEEKKYFVCPDCKRTDESDTDDSDTDDSSSIYTNPVKGMLHRHMGGTGGLW